MDVGLRINDVTLHARKESEKDAMAEYNNAEPKRGASRP